MSACIVEIRVEHLEKPHATQACRIESFVPDKPL